jgi:phosphoribosylformylglycinamidine synthase
MKARVYVKLKSTVLDPQGKTVCSALNGLGYHDVTDVRQGKYFEVTLKDGVDRQKAAEDMNLVARDVLANPVIEE